MAKQESTAEHYDVLIVGAGISGVGGAYYLRERCPDTRFVILEAEENFGGTWWTHRFPGIRSDSDLYTFGYSFKPWIGPPIATAEEILSYMGEVIEENDLAQYIRYGHKILKADWSEEDSRWTVEAVRGETGETLRFTCDFLWMCQGYYRHHEGYTPDWPNMADFQGVIAHTENWPEDLDYAGKNVLVIGSGATAATVIPAMAGTAAHVTMLQRSPTYFRSGRNAIDIADTLRELQVDETWIHEIARRKILFDQSAFTDICFQRPKVAKKQLLDQVRELLGPDYDVDKHFTPAYDPWRQRLAFVPDGDLFEGINSGKASVVTDQIDRFTEKGILLQSGEELEADIIVTATGFNMNVMGDIAFSIDGRPLDFHETVTYRGMMFRRPEPGLGVRLFPGELDAAERVDRGLRLPPLEPYEGDGREERRARLAGRRQGHVALRLDGRGQLQPALPEARHAAPPQTRRQAGMAAHPRLLARKGRIPRDRFGGRGLRLPVGRAVEHGCGVIESNQEPTLETRPTKVR